MLSTGIRTDVGVKIYGAFRYHRSFGTKKKMALKGFGEITANILWKYT
jgi:Cu/Ag efflux pump CusA